MKKPQKQRQKSEVTINKKYKDSLFFFVFGREENKAYLLDLYNALREPGEAVISDISELELNTIENIIYLGRKNDVSFLIDAEMNLYEHQSTYNPNMPLRGLLYWSALMEKWLETQGKRHLYSSKLLKVPAPRHVVFYNGTECRPATEELRLSDAFMKLIPGYEWTTVVYNINPGFNEELLKKCQPLSEYAEFTGTVQQNVALGMDLKEAVEVGYDVAAGGECLGAFFRKHRAEVKRMILEAFDEKEYLVMMQENAREDGLEEGRKEGLEKGRKEGREEMLEVIKKFVQDGLLDIHIAAEHLGMSVEELEKKGKNL